MTLQATIKNTINLREYWASRRLRYSIEILVGFQHSVSLHFFNPVGLA
jgi:hypothetical protein